MTLQWSVYNDAKGKPTAYHVAGGVKNNLPPGVYDISSTMDGSFYLMPVDFHPGDVIRFSDSTVDEVIKEIEYFWSDEARQRFNKFEFPYKRGILLHGPAGTGKTCAVKMIIRDLIKRGGVAIRFDKVHIFLQGVELIRSIHPDMPIVAVMEDLDEIIRKNNLSSLLNLLDGLSGIENVVYLATTNYPERLEARISNRPNRFDRRFEIGYPNKKARAQYIQYLATKDATVTASLSGKRLKRWIKDTDKFTFAHIKDLFVSVYVYEHKYKSALNKLKEMKNKISSDDYDNHSLEKMISSDEDDDCEDDYEYVNS